MDTIHSDSHQRESGDIIVDNHYMPKVNRSNPHKRLFSEQHSVPLQTSTQHLSKRQRLNTSQKPPAFWDNLSKIWLTGNALKELDRRNSSLLPSHRPVTRKFVAKLREEENLEPAVDFLVKSSARRLKKIQLFARHGGPNLTDLRGYQKSASPLVSDQPQNATMKRKPLTDPDATTGATTTTKNTSVYSRNFQQHLIDNGIFPSFYRYPDGTRPTKPNNWKEIKRRLAQPHRSLSPSRFTEEMHEKFTQVDADAAKEEQVTRLVIPLIEGEVIDAKCVSGKIPLKNLRYLTDGSLVSGNPDLYYGARPEQLERQVRIDLGDYIVPTTQSDLPIVPNFFLEVKGRDGSVAVAERQACYDGAFGARGMLQLQSYMQDEVYDNIAYTITSTYHYGTLHMYTSHPVQRNGPSGRTEYIMTHINSWALLGSPETYQEGVTAFRNAIDWTKEQRDEMIENANHRVNDTDTTNQTSSALTSNSTTETSNVEAALSIHSESQSQTSVATQNETSTSETTHHELEMPNNMSTRDLNPSTKRSSGVSESQPRKRGVQGRQESANRAADHLGK
ncbi:290bab11-0fa8-4ffe-a3f6-e626df4feab4 [Sclerotinia trifoliorum]|uniref:290bab11-0fa8-4ffe-a3f6-e626df4feab4 n=1 Tax=Sclerotinia trifoliorum TaxID=28548 RepID=A0A8H2ZKX9_9HELO|nr:290bab11-0fa8-4ffe-a3f6-e626df4feab4 [Sclerotinia trifoliorum]